MLEIIELCTRPTETFVKLFHKHADKETENFMFSMNTKRRLSF